MKGNKHDLLKEKGIFQGANEEDFYLSEGQDSAYVVIFENKRFNSATGERMSKPVKKVFTVNDFRLMEETGYLSGDNTQILHDPTQQPDPLKAEYKKLTGKEPSKRWSKQRLTGEIKSIKKALQS